MDEMIKKYAAISKEERVQFIFKYYASFDLLVEGLMNSLVQKILSDKICNHRRNDDLGIRVKGSGFTKSSTESIALKEMDAMKAVREGIFDEDYFSDVDDADDVIDGIETIFRMRSDFKIFENQLMKLKDKDRKALLSYLSGDYSLKDLADKNEILYNSQKQKLRRIRQVVRTNAIHDMNLWS